MVEFLEKHITTQLKNKLIIMDNASSHRNPRVKESITQHNHLLYAVPYQHFTNSIENYFSMLKITITKVRWINSRRIEREYNQYNNEYSKR